MGRDLTRLRSFRTFPAGGLIAMARFDFSATAVRRTIPLFLAVIFCSAAGQAGEIRLKNGTVLNGNLWLLGKMGDNPFGIGKRLVPKDAPPSPQNIILVDTGWQKYYVPRRQIPDEDVDKDLVPSRPEAFAYKLLKTNQGRIIASVGSIVDVTPFNEFGQRTITLASDKGKLNVIQGISRIEPDHAVLDALNYNWQMGISLKAIPPETLEKLLRQKVKDNDPVARFALVRFYSQAEMYPEAFKELEAIVAAFPDQEARANVVKSELMDYFGREVLRELNRRRAACQHQLAYEYAKRLTTQKLGGSVMDDVKKFLGDYDDMIRSIHRAKNLLADWQAKLKTPGLVEKLQPLRAEINEQLNVETLPRLAAFLQAELDPQLTAEQQLALAYSGWVVGAANAITDLNLAVRYWDARFAVLEAVRAESIQDRDLHYQELRRVEGVGPKVILQLTALLPPILDAGDIRPGQVHRVQVTPEGQTPAIAYSVILPPEYSPHHSYPLLIALRSRDHSNQETLLWWGGNAEQPGPAMRRGYILIAPEYAEERQSDYSYSAAAHQVVIESLRDARRRFNVDSNRVFLTGHGMGADAAFDLGMSHPDEFAGVIPIGGECQHYPKITYMNGRYTSWYVIGRGFNVESRDTINPVTQRDPANDRVFTDIFVHGFQFDFMLVEYLGRGVDRYGDETPKIFDWMDLHRRRPPPKEFEIESLRKTDNRHFWLTVLDLPTTSILPAPTGTHTRITKMDIEPRINEGNAVNIKAPAKRFLVRLSPDLVDFEKRVRVTKDGRQLYNNFVTPEAADILDELRATGDRTRLPLATLDL
jgi:pimeloyl-ACP methyl ester carboxylesterase